MPEQPSSDLVEVSCPKCKQRWRVRQSPIWPWLRCASANKEDGSELGCHYRFPHPHHPGLRRVYLTLALTVASFVFWMLALQFDMIRTAKFDGPGSYTIPESIEKLRATGYPFGAWVVQITAEYIPFAKNTIVFTLLLYSFYIASAGPRVKRIGHVLENISSLVKHLGMVDVICIAITVLVSQTSGLIQVLPGPGSSFLFVYVVLSILTSLSYSKALLWHRPEEVSAADESLPLGRRAWGVLMPVDTAALSIGLGTTVFAIWLMATAPIMMSGIYDQTWELQPGDRVTAYRSQADIGKVGSVKILPDGRALITHHIDASTVDPKLLRCETAKAWIQRPRLGPGGEISGLGSISRKKVVILLGDGLRPREDIPTVRERPFEADIPAGAVRFKIIADSIGRIGPRSLIKDVDTEETLGMITALKRNGSKWYFDAYRYPNTEGQLNEGSLLWPQSVVQFSLDGSSPLTVKPEELIRGVVLAYTPPGREADEVQAKEKGSEEAEVVGALRSESAAIEPATAEPATMELLASEPIERRIPPGAMRVYLRVRKLGGASAGNALYSREKQGLGLIGDCDIPDDFSKPLLIPAYIFKRHSPYIYRETVFVDSSFRLEASPLSIKVELPPLRTLVTGGIMVATPPKGKPRSPIQADHVFDVVYEMPKEVEAWLK